MASIALATHHRTSWSAGIAPRPRGLDLAGARFTRFGRPLELPPAAVPARRGATGGGAPMRGSSSQPPRWQDDGLSISFRSCQLQGLVSLHDALATAQNGGQPVVPSDVMHLDVAENEVELTAGLQPFTQLLSLDLSHNNVEELAQLPSAMLHLNASYNRVQSVEGVRGLTQLVELNLRLG